MEELKAELLGYFHEVVVRRDRPLEKLCQEWGIERPLLLTDAHFPRRRRKTETLLIGRMRLNRAVSMLQLEAVERAIAAVVDCQPADPYEVMALRDLAFAPTMIYKLVALAPECDISSYRHLPYLEIAAGRRHFRFVLFGELNQSFDFVAVKRPPIAARRTHQGA